MNYTAEIYTIKNPSNSLRAYASLVIEVNNTTQMKIKGFKVFEGKNGLFAKPPQTKGKDKEGSDTWYDDIQFVDTTEDNTDTTQDDTDTTDDTKDDELIDPVVNSNVTSPDLTKIEATMNSINNKLVAPYDSPDTGTIIVNSENTLNDK